MKWIVVFMLMIFMGCATPPKRHVRHKSSHKTKVVKASGDDAAIDAIIKALRE